MPALPKVAGINPAFVYKDDVVALFTTIDDPATPGSAVWADQVGDHTVNEVVTVPGQEIVTADTAPLGPWGRAPVFPDTGTTTEQRTIFTTPIQTGHRIGRFAGGSALIVQRFPGIPRILGTPHRFVRTFAIGRQLSRANPFLHTYVDMITPGKFEPAISVSNAPGFLAAGLLDTPYDTPLVIAWCFDYQAEFDTTIFQIGVQKLTATYDNDGPVEWMVPQVAASWNIPREAITGANPRPASPVPDGEAIAIGGRPPGDANFQGYGAPIDFIAVIEGPICSVMSDVESIMRNPQQMSAAVPNIPARMMMGACC